MDNPIKQSIEEVDQEIIRLNAIGLSLATIGKILNKHPTAITLRLKKHNIAPADTRRSFMEDIYKSLPGYLQDGLKEALSAKVAGQSTSIKEYVRKLIIRDLTSVHSQETTTDDV